jgi:phosphatidylglycerol---prolipoprotein diacylglyceryl transferase
MHPTLLDFGRHRFPLFGDVHLALPTYGFLLALGTLLAWAWFVRRGRSLGVADDELFNLSFYSLLAGILGAKLTLVVLDWRSYVADPGQLLGVVRSAGVLIGGILVGALAFVARCLARRLPLHDLGDAVAAPLALGQAVGRLGCFAAGCCWGVPAGSSCPWPVTFDDPEAQLQTGVPLHVPLVPVQLYQMVHDFALCLFLTWLWRRRPRPAGTVFWVYVLLYGIGRSLLELWRGDAQRGLFFSGRLSTSQILSILAVVLAAVMLVLGRLRPRPAPAVRADR